MPPASPILQTKISPPPVTPRTLARGRVTGQLLEALNYRLTVLQARAGYGKSTALATLAAAHRPVIWYQVAREDNDLSVFLLHLFHAARNALPDTDGLPIAVLEAWDATLEPFPLQAVVYQFLNAIGAAETPVLLVLDDAHLVLDNAEIAQALDHAIGLAPANLHVLLSSRTKVDLPNLSRWRLLGDVLTFDQSFLVFTREEIAALFERHYHYDLTEEEAGILHAATEGWAITLQLIWQNLRSGGLSSVSEDLARQDKPLESLFEMLAQEVLAAQPEDVRRFLLGTAVLRELTPDACDAVLGSTDASTMLAYLRRQEFFVVDLDPPGGEALRLRYHYIFHRFLQGRSSDAERRAWHTAAAGHFLVRGDHAAAIHHFLRAENHTETARLLVDYGGDLLAQGRLDSLASVLDALPPATLSKHPALLYYLGDLARLRSRFEESLGWYGQAETLWREKGQPDGVSRALRGQARVYLDTLNPGRAEELLQQSLRLSDGAFDREAQARLLELLAENKLNTGDPVDAERLRREAEDLRLEGPSDKQLLYRVLLRTGRLAEAIQKLEAQAELEREEPFHTPRAHRETPLLLSILYAFIGERERALHTAREGTDRGLELNSPFVTAVGHMRQGHALSLFGPDRYAEARESFLKTIELSNQLAVPRLLVEANWGLCRVHGYGGDLDAAQETARTAIELAAQYGDEWLNALTRLAMGSSLLFAGRYETAGEWLNLARRVFDECSDAFGTVVAQLILCLGRYRQGQRGALEGSLTAVLAACRGHGYGFLFTRPTLLAVPDERILTPLLVLARSEGWEARYAEELLGVLDLPEVSLHPGYRLDVVTLGSFQTRLGDRPVPPGAWVRAAARQLWQLLLTHYDAPLDREQILEYLWPGAELEAAQRNFKVALNSLYKALEPDRPPGVDSAYVLREGTVYALRPGADLRLDARDFIRAVTAAEGHAGGPAVPHADAVPLLESALALYQGEYLPEARYEPWAARRREQLAGLFLRTADKLCSLYLEEDRPDDAAAVAHRMLAEDPCWERAYQHLMRAHVRLGDHGQAARVYHRCVEILRDEMDVAPSDETEHLYRGLTGPL
ncbi:MAG TPA: BTAD domain-containing putative transcriptional regulator [Anaerolineales bacterium]|nr:BTAD domain-containing putative transcriptional regulator [Anaerolineales bacterium]